ncbi:MAG: hypothetical protein K9J83_07715 [Desulfarculaceae bacterium]|nr:hypothetical protein [Desulfarculaceae bacterium]
MKRNELNWLDRTMMAITFAEAGEDQQAVKYLSAERKQSRTGKSSRPHREVEKENRPRMQL